MKKNSKKNLQIKLKINYFISNYNITNKIKVIIMMSSRFESKKILCKFYNSKDGCRNGSNCQYLHDTDNWRINSELLPGEIINNEVLFAINSGKLNDLFHKMLTNPDDYIKYYKTVNIHFRNIAVWKLEKKSIRKNLIDTLTKTNISDIQDGKYGYIPFCYHFIMNGLVWRTFMGGSAIIPNYEIKSPIAIDMDINSCFDEIIDVISSINDNKNSYSEIVKLTTEYVNPSTYETVLHTATYHLSDSVMSHIKLQLKEYKISILKKDHTIDQIAKLSDNVLNEYFNALLLEKNKYDENILGIYNHRKNTKDNMILKYKEIFNKNEKFALRQKNSKELIEHAKVMLKYSIDSLNLKLNSFHNEIFDQTKYQHRRVIVIDYDSIFNAKLKNILKTENKLGVPCDVDILLDLLNFIIINFNATKEEKINKILSSLPKNIMNSDKINNVFKEKGLIEFIWSYITKSINFENPLSNCPPILYEFMNEEKLGIREAYIGEFFTIIHDIIDFLSTENKDMFMKKLFDSELNMVVKEQFI